MNALRTKTGELTQYAFDCGYVQSIRTEALDKELYKEHNTYHVRSTKHNKPVLNTKYNARISHSFLIWESYERLTDAKKFYKSIK